MYSAGPLVGALLQVRQVLMPKAKAIRAELSKVLVTPQYSTLTPRPASEIVCCADPTCFGMLEASGFQLQIELQALNASACSRQPIKARCS